MQSDRRIVSFLSLEKKDTRRVLNGMEHLQINVKKETEKKWRKMNCAINT